MANDKLRQSQKQNRRRQSRSNTNTYSNPDTPIGVATSETPMPVSNPAPKVVTASNQATTIPHVVGRWVPEPVQQLESIRNLIEVAQQSQTSTVVETADSCAELHQQWSNAIESKLSGLVDQAKTFERERLEIEQLREHLRQAIDVAESRLEAASSDESLSRLSSLENQLVELNQENAKLSSLLLNTRTEYQSLLDFILSEPSLIDSDPDGDDESDYDSNENLIRTQLIQSDGSAQLELTMQIAELQEQIEFLNSELNESKACSAHSVEDSSDLRIQVEKLRSQLLDARHDAVESRLQNTELSSNLARYEEPNNKRNEALTWDQRKQALLRQLEAETHGEELCDPKKVLDIERVLEQTDSEIARRDREIADLRSLLEQQAIAQNGMAIGVAAVAEMIETDALIVAERLRMQEVQQDWEKKQRQAEIEMSLERAKLARERLELQEKTRAIAAEQPFETDAEKKVIKERGRGRWLARLGLKDE
jgi:regulator of replication initiation timing